MENGNGTADPWAACWADHLGEIRVRQTITTSIWARREADKATVFITLPEGRPVVLDLTPALADMLASQLSGDNHQ